MRFALPLDGAGSVKGRLVAEDLSARLGLDLLIPDADRAVVGGCVKDTVAMTRIAGAEG